MTMIIKIYCGLLPHSTALSSLHHTMRRTLQAIRSPTPLQFTGGCHRYLQVYSQGEGFLGCLGHGDLEARERCEPVSALASKDVRRVSAGWTHSAAVCSEGGLYVWGRPFDLKQPLRINRLQRVFPFVVRVINYAADKRELLARPVLFSVGRDAMPDAPRLTYDARPPSTSGLGASIAPVSQPETVVKAVDVACSGGLTVVLGDDARVYCMGYNGWGQCGQGSKNVFTVFEPLRVGGGALDDERVTSLAVGFQHVLVLCESGNVYGWGKSVRGQLGVGADMVELPAPVGLPAKVVSLSSGYSHAAAVLEDGDVYVWGRMQGVHVKLDSRVPVFEDQLYPRRVDLPEGSRAVEVSCSSFNTIVRVDDGRLMMFGREADTRKTRHVPVEVKIPASTPVSVLKGHDDTIIRTRSSTAAQPELYTITLTSEGAQAAPLELPGLNVDGDTCVEDVSVGWQHTLALVK